MAKTCDICGRGSQMAGKRKLLRGHYNPTGKVRKYLNLQTARTLSGKKLLICTRCMKAGKHLQVK